MFTEVNKKQWQILEEFFDDPDLESSIRELSRRTGISPRWVSKNVEELSNQKYLNIEESNISKKISRGEKFMELKEIYNLANIKDSDLIGYLDEELRPDALILFGSYERGEDRKDSDIDIAVINGREKEIDLEEFEKFLGREIQLQHIEKPRNTDKNFLNSLVNGKTLSGFAELVK